MIKSIKEWKQYNENVLVPRNLDSRKDKLKQYNIELLSKEVIEGNLEIDESFEEIPEELIKVKEIKGHVNLLIKKGYIPSWLKNVKIEGYFGCSNNNLTTLDNCPQYISDYFDCSYNRLTSLEGCPKYIGGNFWCIRNIDILELPDDIVIKGSFNNKLYISNDVKN